MKKNQAIKRFGGGEKMSFEMLGKNIESEAALRSGSRSNEKEAVLRLFLTAKYFASNALIVFPGNDFSAELFFSRSVSWCTYSSSSSSARQ